MTGLSGEVEILKAKTGEPHLTLEGSERFVFRRICFDSSGTTLATVMLQASGDISLTPAAGRKVVIAGDLDVGHVSYLPSGGGGKKNLT